MSQFLNPYLDTPPTVTYVPPDSPLPRRSGTILDAYISQNEATAVVAHVAEKYRTTVEDIRSRNRTRKVCNARYAAAWVLEQRGMTLVEIGDMLGRDHSTVVEALHRVRKQCDEDPNVATSLRELIAWRP